MATINAGKFDTLRLPKGQQLTVNAGSSAIVERFRGSDLLEKTAQGATTQTYGPYLFDCSFKVSAFVLAVTYSVGEETDTIDEAAALAAMGLPYVVTGLILDADDLISAAANSTIINAALATYGEVIVSAPLHTVYINQSLIVSGSFKVAPLTTLKLCTGSNKNPIVSSGHSRYYTNNQGVAITSLTSSGLICTALTADTSSLSVGGFVSISGGTISGYNGTYQVLSIVPNTSFTYRAQIKPRLTTCTGTIKFIRADERIRIDIQGTLDCNRTGNGTASGGILGIGVLLGHVYDYQVTGRIINCGTRCMQPYNARKGYVHNIVPDATDGSTNSYVAVQVMGAIHDLTIERVLSYDATDDGIAIMASESNSYPTLQWSAGDVIGVRVIESGCCGNTGGNAAHIYSFSTEWVMDGIEIISPRGSQTTTPSIAMEGTASEKGNLRTVRIISPRITTTILLSVQNLALFEHLYMEDVEVLTPTGLALSQWIAFQNSAVIKKFTVNGIDVSNVAQPASGLPIIADLGAVTDTVKITGAKIPIANCYLIQQAGPTTQKYIFEDITSDGGSQILLQSSGSIKSLAMRSIRTNGGGNYVTLNAACPTITLDDIQLLNSHFLSCQGAFVYNVGINGLDMTNGAGHFVDIGASATVNVSGINFNMGSGTLATISAGGTLNPKSPSVPVNVTTTGVSNANGNMAYHTGATNPGPCVAGGAGWKRIFDGAVPA